MVRRVASTESGFYDAILATSICLDIILEIWRKVNSYMSTPPQSHCQSRIRSGISAAATIHI